MNLWQGLLRDVGFKSENLASSVHSDAASACSEGDSSWPRADRVTKQCRRGAARKQVHLASSV